MAEMVNLEKFFCRSGPWRAFARKFVLPWALQGTSPAGRGLEIGAGTGMMAAELLRSFPDLQLTITDFDSSMLQQASTFAGTFGSRATVEVADASGLSFPDESFDYVFSFIMLHHVMEWEKAIGEAVRVLRPGGWLIGYDVLDTRLFRVLHKLERAEVRLMRLEALAAALDDFPVDRAVLTKGLGGSVVRFKIRKGAKSNLESSPSFPQGGDGGQRPRQSPIVN